MSVFERQSQRLEAGPPPEAVQAGKWEVRMAHTLLWTFAATLPMSLLEEQFGETIVAIFAYLAAGPVFISWVALTGIHCWRCLTGRYSIATALAALFVPLFGLVWVSLHLPRQPA